MAQWVKHFLKVKPNRLSSPVGSLGSTWWKGRTNSCELSSDYTHTRTHACTHPFIHSHPYTHTRTLNPTSTSKKHCITVFRLPNRAVKPAPTQVLPLRTPPGSRSSCPQLLLGAVSGLPQGKGTEETRQRTHT